MSGVLPAKVALLAAAYVLLFGVAVGSVALALVMTGDGVWLAGMILLMPPAGLGLWMSRE